MLRILFWGMVFSFIAVAEVVVETQPFGLGNANEKSELYRVLDQQLRAGLWDSAQISFRVGDGLLKVTSQHYSRFNKALQQEVLSRLASYYNRQELATYRVNVEREKNRLEEEAVIRRLQIELSQYSATIPAEKLLSPYAQKWAYQMSKGYGANCWHTSMASIFLNWNQGRRMPPKEFSCLISNYFEPIDKPTQWGDLIRLSQGGEDVHGFTFLGIDSQDRNRSIVFTKNGRWQSRFLFMDLLTVREQIYPGNEISFFRAKKMAIDPKEDPSAPCQFQDEGSWKIESERDPIVEAGIRLFPPITLEPIAREFLH